MEKPTLPCIFAHEWLAFCAKSLPLKLEGHWTYVHVPIKTFSHFIRILKFCLAALTFTNSLTVYIELFCSARGAFTFFGKLDSFSFIFSQVRIYFFAGMRLRCVSLHAFRTKGRYKRDLCDLYLLKQPWNQICDLSVYTSHECTSLQ